MKSRILHGASVQIKPLCAMFGSPAIPQPRHSYAMKPVTRDVCSTSLLTAKPQHPRCLGVAAVSHVVCGSEHLFMETELRDDSGPGYLNGFVQLESWTERVSLWKRWL